MMNRTCVFLICFNGPLDDFVLFNNNNDGNDSIKKKIFMIIVWVNKKTKLDQCLLMGHQLKSIKKPLIGVFI